MLNFGVFLPSSLFSYHYLPYDLFVIIFKYIVNIIPYIYTHIYKDSFYVVYMHIQTHIYVYIVFMYSYCKDK